MTRRRVSWLAIAACAAAVTGGLGCGGRCPEIAGIKRALDARTEIAPGPHAQVRIPLARANAFIAELLREAPLAVAIELPSFGALPIAGHALTAIAREVRLRPAADDRLRFALRIELDDAQRPVTTLAIETEVTPRLVHGASGATELVTAFGPDNLVAVHPVLGDDAEHALGDAIARWLPPGVRDHLPRGVLDRAAGALGEHLTGAAYRLLQTTLLRRLGELTELRIELPALPIAKVALRSSSSSSPAPDPAAGGEGALTIDLTTDLAVRRGLPAGAPVTGDVEVRIAGSTAAELANWAIDHGRLPQHYSRDLAPRPDGEHRPRFDYLADDRQRPLVIHVFQDRGGCSYFRVGLRLALAITGDRLEVAIHDQRVETAIASPVIELALWLKQLILGAAEQSRQAAAHTRVTVGGRTFVTRAVRAAVTDGELRFALQFSAAPAAVHATPPPIVR